MRIIAQSNLADYWDAHPETRPSLERWIAIVRSARWHTTSDVQSAFATAKVLNNERVRFAISGGSYRLIVSFKFKNQIAFVKFIGTHAEYDRVDAISISMF